MGGVLRCSPRRATIKGFRHGVDKNGATAARILTKGLVGIGAAPKKACDGRVSTLKLGVDVGNGPVVLRLKRGVGELQGDLAVLLNPVAGLERLRDGDGSKASLRWVLVLPRGHRGGVYIGLSSSCAAPSLSADSISKIRLRFEFS
jgi:hypothetical protein